MANFTEILSRKAEEVEKPKPLPVGQYLWSIPNLFEQEEIGENKTPALIWKVKCVAPQSDVDMAALAESGNAKDREQRVTFFLTEDALWRLRDFLTKLGVTESGRSLAEMAADATNRMFYATVKHRWNKDKTQLFGEVDTNTIASAS